MKAPSTGPDAHGRRPVVPRSVALACQLFVVSYVLSLALLLPGVGTPLESPSVAGFVALLVFVVAWGAVTLWLIGAILQRRNWGRWVLLGLLGLSWFGAALEIVEIFQGSFIEGAVDVCSTAMEMVGCVLLFSGAGAQWFSPAQGGPDAGAT